MGIAAGREQVAQLMGRFRSGDSVAAGELVQLFYPELRKIAATRMRTEAPGHTWQPTVLVNELYLQLVRMKTLRAATESDGEAEKAAFLRLAAFLMKQLLIQHARPLAKRSMRGKRSNVSEIAGLVDARHTGQDILAEVEGTLDRLGSIDPKLRTVVELRIFEGLTGNETAERMACSPKTVTRYWTFAAEWLGQELGRTQ
jgi:RNA polymerase sigma factor (TIGR02999 family)